MPTQRGTTNRNERGSTRDRRARKRWLLTTFGDGVSAMCAFDCGTRLTVETISVDRHPVPGWAGGTYVRGNIRPACRPCNSADGGRQTERARRTT